MTRRTLVGSVALAAASRALNAQRRQRPEHSEWKPLLGVLGPYTPANVAWTKAQGFTNMILGSSPRSTLDANSLTDSQIADIKTVLSTNQMHVSALQVGSDSINPDLTRRAHSNDYFVKAIELAGKLGVPYIGTQSGRDRSKPFQKQIDEIVQVYNEKFFPACERAKVRILWEPWPDGENLATSPAGFSALFKGFGDSPYVGLQYDPSHLVRQFMDPIYHIHRCVSLHGVSQVGTGDERSRYRTAGVGDLIRHSSETRDRGDGGDQFAVRRAWRRARDNRQAGRGCDLPSGQKQSGRWRGCACRWRLRG